MKKILILMISSILVFSCDDFSLENQGFSLRKLDGYVAFANAGGTVTPIVRNLTESSPNSVLRIETATGTLSDITVTYAFSGTAVFGTDFTVSSPGGTVSATGGTILLKKNTKKNGVNDFDFVNLGIDPITDGVTDGAKTLTITLVSAVNADGVEFVVGRGAQGGTIYMLSATINMADIN